ncbi:MAG: sigma-70 family RNA polymerase sigma factor [Erysipelotrichales bacterium]|nr:sigma-70 family RNA polymerase sigma factor [Erysipelotrichales bacterium]
MSLTRKLYMAYKSGNCKKIEQLFSLIYNEYADLVFVIVSKYVKQYENIEEITDDVFIQLFNHLENIDPSKDVKYYLMSSAKNASINFLKKHSKEEIFEDSFDDYDSSYDSYDNLLIEDWKKVLSKEEMQLILKHVVEGFSLRELALINNQSSNTIKSIYRRAIKKLQRFYEVKEYEKTK